MPPKKRATKMQRTVKERYDAGERPVFGKSGIARLGTAKMTDTKGRVTEQGQLLRDYAKTKGDDIDYDPWVRGTELIRKQIYAQRRSGKKTSSS